MSDAVAIIGLGLIGGSLARDLSTRGVRVLGSDTDRRTEQAALDAGVIHATIDGEYKALADARCIVIATPVTFARRRASSAVSPHRNSGAISATSSGRGGLVSRFEAGLSPAGRSHSTAQSRNTSHSL